MLVTAFGPFADIKRNPSEVLARALFGDYAVILPVSFAAVDAFLDNLQPTDRLLMLGVGRGDKRIRIERSASDYIGKIADVTGCTKPREKSDTLQGTLLTKVCACDCWEDSDDAGGYLCNYIYYEATRKYPNIATGFVHIPPFTAMSRPIQEIRLRRLVNLISL